MTLKDASERLAVDAGCTPDAARSALQRFLLAAHAVKTPQGRAPFAFKLHQFISGPGKVMATLEAPGVRNITQDVQRFAPGRQAEAVQLYATHFCRDCGQEYHPVWHSSGGAGDLYSPREIDDITADDEDDRYGFLCPRREGQQYRGALEDLPEAWLDVTRNEPRVKP
ncbi:DEAD/DEAH box helicase domain protein, partial [mine drainage metagenome]